MNERAEQTNDVLGRLTVLGTIVLPMNIITGMWGMNCLGMPFSDFDPLETIADMTLQFLVKSRRIQPFGGSSASPRSYSCSVLPASSSRRKYTNYELFKRYRRRGAARPMERGADWSSLIGTTFRQIWSADKQIKVGTLTGVIDGDLHPVQLYTILGIFVCFVLYSVSIPASSPLYIAKRFAPNRVKISFLCSTDNWDYYILV